ncbi:MAG: IS1595 family transposase [bacterium]|nr:IS1595 family transposase [bacterium]
MYKDTDLLEFIKTFSTSDDCLKYIATIKWPNNMYTCSKCGNTNFCKGKQNYSRRCTRCKYDESPTSKTMFERIGFDLLRAFHILYALSVRKKGISSYEIENEYSISQEICWRFRNKIQRVMKSTELYPLSGNIDVDEFLVGGPEEGKRGRSHGKKKLVIIALERLSSDKFGRSYMKQIKQSSTKEFRPFFNSYISENAFIRTDNWKAYTALKDDYPNLEQIDSNKGKNFRELHIQIMNFKGWLRGIHHHCSKMHMQGYLDEYCYRFNRRNYLNTIFHKLIERMVNNKPVE